MLEVVDPDAAPLEAAGPKAAPVAAPVEAPAACVDQRIEKNVSEDEANSQDAAFETWLSAQPWKQVSKGSGEMDPREILREAMAKSRLAKSRLAGRELPANGRESPGRAN